MATARDEIRRAMGAVDGVIEILDARIPRSSENPLVADLVGATPRLRVLNKADLADPAVTARWIELFSGLPRSAALAHQHGAPGLRRGLLATAARLVPAVRGRPLVWMVMGIPNVGKSTLVNALAGRAVARAADKPAVTRMLQKVPIDPGLVLVDTPGLLWPKLDPPERGVHLAITGAVGDRAVDAEEIAHDLGAFLLSRHADRLAALYRLDPLPEDPQALVAAVARRRGFVGRGGAPDLGRAATHLLLAFRDGSLGRISLEAPAG